MIITTSGGNHVCHAAEQRTDGVYLLDESGKVTLIITNPSDIKNVLGGEITVVDELPPTDKERITALEEENAVLLECLLEMSEIVYA